MGIMYEIISPYSVILSSITDCVDILSIENKGTKLDILEYNKTDLWSYFKFNNNDAYILKSDLKLVTGLVTIKYIDKPTQIEIATEDVIENLSMGNYTYNAKAVEGYRVLCSPTKTITLTDESPNASITFEYDIAYLTLDVSKQNEVPYISTYYIKPVVEVGEEVFIDYYITDYYYKEYLEEDYSENFTVTVRIEGKTDKVFRNMKAGDHQVSLGSFSNLGEQKFSILCTDAYGRNSHELFNFFLVRNPIVWNEYVMTEEDLKTYNIKNTDNYEVKKIIDLSTLSNKTSARVKAALVDTASKIIPNSKTYVCVIADTTGDGTPDNWWAENQVVYASDYDKDAVLQESINTRKGLQQLLDDKKSAGFNKLKLLNGFYRIDHQSPLYIPSEFTLDLNYSTIKLNQFTGDSCLMLTLNNTFNSHVVNGIIDGDYFSHDYSNSNNNSEWPLGVQINGEAKYSSFENLTIKNITGYGSTNGISKSRDGILDTTYLSPMYLGNIFVLGDIDRNTGLSIPSNSRTTCDYKDISGYSDIGYLSINRHLGYQGNPCGTWNLICHFYDAEKNYIKSIDAYQYRRINVPVNSKYIRITILNIAYPTDLFIEYFRIPTHCSFKNINYENCRCVGMAPAAMNNMLVDSCEFTNCGQSGAKCAFDAEDGWDMMQDTTFKTLKFNNNPNNHFLTCAGHNFIIDGQVNGKIYIWSRTRALLVKNCKKVDITLQSGGKEAIVQHGVYRIFNNEFTGGTVANNLSKNNISTGTLSGLVYNSTIAKPTSNSYYYNCVIEPIESHLGYLSNLTMINCVFNSNEKYKNKYTLTLTGSTLSNLNDRFFENCKFYGKSQFNISGKTTLIISTQFKDCLFNDSYIVIDGLNLNSNNLTLFENCSFRYSSNSFTYLDSYGTNPCNFGTVKFTNCTINNINNNLKPFIYIYSHPDGYFKFINCTISIPSSITMIDGNPINNSLIQSLSIEFNKTPIPTNIKLISDSFKNNSNIKILVQ